jgi:hypothetical protein
MKPDQQSVVAECVSGLLMPLGSMACLEAHEGPSFPTALGQHYVQSQTLAT